jgi:hypothetical protein
MSSGTSYNGWPANSDKGAIGIEPFGDAVGLPFPGGVKGGDVATVLGYVATQLHYRVEECVAGWDWGYTYKANVNNPSQLSCHASGTAIDWNAPDHPNGSSGTFTDAQVGEIYSILDEVEGAVDWLEGYDEMHFEIAVGASTLASIAARLPAGGQVPPTPEEPTIKDEDGMTASVQVNGNLNVFAIATDGAIYQQWPDPNSPSGWSGWIAGVPGAWSGGLSVTAGADGGFSLFGVDPDGTVCQVWSTPDGWQGPAPFAGITAL